MKKPNLPKPDLSKITIKKKAGFKDYLSFFKKIPRVLKLVWDASPGLFAISFAAALITSFNPVIQAFVSKLVIDKIVEIVKTGSDYREAIPRILTLLTIAFVVACLRSLLGRIQNTGDTLLRDKFILHLNTILFKKASQLNLRFFEDPKFYDRYEMVRRYSMYRPIDLLWAITEIFSELVSMSTFIFIAIRFQPLITIGFLVLGLPSVFFDLFFARRFYSLSDSRTPENRKAWYLSHLLFSDRSIKEIKIFGLAPYFIKRFRKIALKYYNEVKTLIVRREIYNILLAFLSNVAYFLAFLYLIIKALQQKITIGDLTFYRTAFNSIDRGFGNILRRLTRIYEYNLYLDDLLEFLNLEPDAFEITKGKKVDLSKIGLEIKDLWFKYPGTDKWVLKNVNLAVEPGKSLALVGENGAGKTTLIKLICGFYKPTKGQILVNGKDLMSLNKKEYRKHIGVIFQDFTGFNLTVRENIGFGKVNHLNDLEKIKKAAQKAGADKIIAGLPKKYETILGRWFEGGKQLSIGEWQKLALARAFMSEAPLLILDEPTASVDAKTEYQLFKKFEKMTQEKSVILISHRFSTARIADRIIVMHKGRITESGTHKELLASSGKYAELFSLQAEGYR